MIGDRDHVHAEYGRLFHPDRLDRLTAEDFKAFLLYRNNRHWDGIHRQQAKLVVDMPRLRSALVTMLDESQPIVKRLDWIAPATGPKPIPGIGKAVITPILHVVYPDRYGVWNTIAESALTRLGFWPKFGRTSFGHRYVAVNEVLKTVANQLGTDLWTVDALWWRVERDHEPTKHPFEGRNSESPNPKATRTLPGRLKGSVRVFVCKHCYMSKPTSLRSKDASDVCVDCAR